MEILNLEDKDADEILDLFQKMEEFGDIKRFVIVLWGPEKVGKTHVALTASRLIPKNPTISSELREMLKDGRVILGEPVWLIDTEGKSPKLKDKFTGRDIRILPVWVPDENNPLKPDVEKSLKNLMYALIAMSKQPKGTLVIDSWTDPNSWARKLVQKKLVENEAEGWELGELIPLKPTDYEGRNDIMDFILYYLQNYIKNMHVILTVRGEPKWVTNSDGKRPHPGPLAKKCNKKTMFFADVEIKLLKNLYDDGTAERVGSLITSEFDDDDPISKDWVNPNIPKIIDDLKDFAIKKRKMTEKKKPKKKKAKKKKTTKRKSKKKSKRPVKRGG